MPSCFSRGIPCEQAFNFQGPSSIISCTRANNSLNRETSQTCYLPPSRNKSSNSSPYPLFSNNLLRLSISFVDVAESYDTDVSEDGAEDDQVDETAKDGKILFSISCIFALKHKIKGIE